MSYDEYVALVDASETQYEYVNGEAYATAGGTPRHSAVCANVLIALGNLLRGQPCRVYQSDLRVRVEATGMSTYPDVTIVCGPVATSPKDRVAATNPRVIVEVTSESTEAYDRGAKFQHYQAIPSLTDYVVVASDRERVDHFTREPDGSWRLWPIGPTAPRDVRITSIDATLALDDVYAKLDDTPIG
jgi:Uma2 family endonuclease